MGRPRILLADDHTLVVEGFRKLLETEFEIVGVASDGRALLAAALQEKPDVIILDIGMPFLSGIDAGRELKRLVPRTRLIFWVAAIVLPFALIVAVEPALAVICLLLVGLLVIEAVRVTAVMWPAPLAVVGST